jgi:N-acetylmuramoyl-L-alanine amidase
MEERNTTIVQYFKLLKLLLKLNLILAFFLIAITANISVTEAVDNQTIVQVKVERLNMRTGPSTSFTKIDGLSAGTPLYVLFQEGDWLLVQLQDGRTGWVCSEYTSFSAKMVDTLPTIIGEKTNVEVNLLNVRVGPESNYDKINQLNRNYSVLVYFEKGKWLLVRLADGSSGWIFREHTSYISKDELAREELVKDYPGEGITRDEKESMANPEDKPAGEPADEKIKTPGEKDTQGKMTEQYPFQVIADIDFLLLRNKPGLDNFPIDIIPTDTVLTVLQSDENGWLQVTLPDGKQGWVAGWHTKKINAEEKNEPPETYFRLATVKADILRVRSGPGLRHTQTGRVYSGNHLLALQEQDGWYYVQTPTGQYGWISGEHVSLIEVASDVSRNNPSRAGSIKTQNITLVIDPGHGGSDSGATGITGLKEKNVNLTVSLYLADLLQSRGFNVVLTRKSDVNISLSERVAKAEKAKADLFISIHANAHLTNIFASGTETYYYQNKSTSPQSFYLASLLQQETTRLLKLPNRGVKTKPFHVIKETSMPSVLLELAFLSNAVDEKMLKSNDFLKLGAEGVYRGILRYYNLEP